MALIIYPADGADSFVTVAEADSYIQTLTLNYDQWSILSESDKEIYLRIAYRFIIENTDSDLYPDPIPDCVGESQSLMAVHDLVNGLSSGTESAETGAIKKNKVGSIEQEFYDVKTQTSSYISRVPDNAQACLIDIGYSYSNISGLKQTTLGHS